MTTLPCISIRPPWSHFIARLPFQYRKDVENRSWSTSYRGPILIHASKGCTRREYEEACAFAEDHAEVPQEWLPPYDQLERGGIVGAARLTGIIEPGESDYLWHVPDCYGFELEDLAQLPFRPYRGALGLFSVRLTPEEEHALRTAKLIAA